MAPGNMEGVGSKALGIGSAAAELEGMAPHQRTVSILHMGYWKVFLRGISWLSVCSNDEGSDMEPFIYIYNLKLMAVII